MCTEVNSQTPVKQRPILFSTEMVKAILARRKTMTRRIMADPPAATGNRNEFVMNMEACPFGKVGDILWVREEHYRYGHWEPVTGVKTPTGRQKWAFIPETSEFRYYNNPPKEFRKGMHNSDPQTSCWYKRLGRFMPKEACRLSLRITGRRIERLQDISEQDAIAEGVETLPNGNWKCYVQYADSCYTARASFDTLWEFINGSASRKANPWVWVVSFERIPLNAEKLVDRSCQSNSH